MNNSKSIALGGIKSRPSLFDIGLYLFSFLSPIFFLPNWDLNMIQGIFFIFGIFFLLGLSFISLRQREYKGKALGLIILWSLLGVFIHSFSYSLGQGIFKSFVNFSLLSEGFIFVLCGCLLFYLVTTYTTRSFNIIYPVLAINTFNLIFLISQKIGINLIWSNVPIICGMMGTIYQLKIFSALSIPILCAYRIKTIWIPVVIIPIINLCLTFKTKIGFSFAGIIALCLTLLIYLWKSKNLVRFYSALGVIGIFILYFMNDLVYKVINRFYTWSFAIKQVILNPIFGKGFDNSMTGNTVLTKHGWSLINNDYLNIARDMGMPFLIFIVWGIMKILYKSKLDYLWFTIILVMIASFFQTNIYYPRVSSIAIILLGLKQTEKLNVQI